MKSSDIDDQHVIDLARSWADNPFVPGVVQALMREGIPEKLAVAKVMRLVDRDFLEYGTSPYHAWPTGKTLPTRKDASA